VLPEKESTGRVASWGGTWLERACLKRMAGPVLGVGKGKYREVFQRV